MSADTDTGTSVIEGTDTKEHHMPMYRVLIHNDDTTPMDTVVYALKEVFKFEVEKCVEIMFEAHTSGVALCRVCPMEHAELYQEQMQTFGITATIEPE